MGEAPRYATLRDYLRVLREQRILIIVIAAVFAGVALWLAERQDPVYEAQAAVQFVDQSQDYLLVGTPIGPQVLPGSRATIEAATATRTEVLAKAAKDLRVKEPLTRLRNAVSAKPDVTTGLVIIKASWGDREFAARIPRPPLTSLTSAIRWRWRGSRPMGASMTPSGAGMRPSTSAR